MNPEFISRVVGLVQKNGDRVVLADSAAGKAVVVLDLESYERLCGGAASDLPRALAAADVPIGSEAISVGKKTAKNSENSAKQKVRPTEPAGSVFAAKSGDLTQEELLDKINRDIGDWKTAQERRRADELKAAVQGFGRAVAVPAALEAAAGLSDEERFYLEPIE